MRPTRSMTGPARLPSAPRCPPEVNVTMPPRRINPWSTQGPPADMNRSSPRPLTALYVAGPFSMGYIDFYTFLMPLYAVSLGFDAAEVGILVGARSIIAMFLSIHIGVLMDRFGTRKVALFFVW